MSSLSVDLVSELLLESDTIAPKTRNGVVREWVVCTKDPVVGKFIKSENSPSNEPFGSKDMTFILRKGQKLRGDLVGSTALSTKIYLPVDPQHISLEDSNAPGLTETPLETEAAVKVTVGAGPTGATEVMLQQDVKITLPHGYAASIRRKVQQKGKSSYQMLCNLTVKSGDFAAAPPPAKVRLAPKYVLRYTTAPR
jgi:hypothetical protein